MLYQTAERLLRENEALKRRLALAEAVIAALTDEWERTDYTFSEVGAKLYATREMIDALAAYREATDPTSVPSDERVWT